MGWLEIHRTIRGEPVEFREEFSDDFAKARRPRRILIVHPDGRLEDVSECPPVQEPGDRCLSAKLAEDPFKPKATPQQVEAEPQAESPEDERADDEEDDGEKEHPLHAAIENMLKSKPVSDAERLPESLPNVSEWELGNLDNLGPRATYKMVENLEARQELEDLRERARRAATSVHNLVNANRARRCLQVKSDGTTCLAPAWGDRLLCYFHFKTQMKHYTEPDSQRLELPVLEDTRSLQIAITQICRFMADNRIDVKTGRALLYGVRMAERNLPEEEL